MSKPDSIQAVADIGCSQIRASVARSDGSGMEIIGCGTVNAPSMKNGIITDIAATAAALRAAADEAERQSGFEIRNVDVALGGAQIAGINSAAESRIHDGRIRAEDTAELVQQARNRVSDDKHRLLHVLEQQFVVDEHCGITTPVGMMADNLEAQLHVIRAQKNIAENLTQTVEAAGIGVNAIVSAGLASSIAASTAEERELGVCVLDIGAGTTDFMVWQQDCPLFSGGINVGGEQISSNLAVKFSTTRQFADMVKCQQGAVLMPLMKAAFVELPSTGLRASRQIPAQEAVALISESYMDLFADFEKAAHRHGMRQMSKGGFVLTGGAAQIPGLAAFVQESFGVPVRIAKPPQVQGLPDHLQHDAGMMSTLGMFKLLYEPIADYIWAKPAKPSIISQFKQFLKQRSR